jgi:L-alanine-DL-glutamate epimerase-like enolase superfamily enzyme
LGILIGKKRMPRDSSPIIQAFKVRAVRVPMTEPHRTASGVITESPLVLTDVITDTGISGHSMVFTYTPAALKPTAELICNLEALVKGELLAPIEIEQKLTKRFRLLGTQGLVGIALAAIDMALLVCAGPRSQRSACVVAGRGGEASSPLWRFCTG